MQKPTGVKIIAIVFFIFGGLAILSGFGVLAFPVPAGIADIIPISKYQIGIGVGSIVIGGIEIAVAWALWNLQNWARIAAIILLALSAISGIASGVVLISGIEVDALIPISVSLPGPGVLSIIIGLLYVWGVWYLFTPDVAAAFDRGSYVPPTMVAPPMSSVAPPPPPPIAPPPAPTVVPVAVPVGPAPQRPPQPTEVMGGQSPATAWLVARGRAGNKSHALAGDNITIGRDPNRAVIVLEGDTISGEHARIRVEGGQFYLHDLASTNGTFVNNHRVQRHLLRDNDVVRFGQVELVFKKA